MHRPLFYPNVTCGTPKCDTDVAQAHHETETQPSLHKLPLFRALLRAPAAPPPGARNMLRPSRGHRPVTKGTVHSSKPFHYKEEEGSEAREGDRGLRLQHARVLVFPFWFAGYFLTSDPCSFFSVFLFFFFFSYLNRKYRVAKTPPRGPQPCRRACALPASTPSRRQVDPTAPRLAAPLRSASAAHSRTHTLCGATLGRWGVPHRPPLLSALQPAGGMEAGSPQRCQYSEVECPVALVFSFSFFLVPCS